MEPELRSIDLFRYRYSQKPVSQSPSGGWETGAGLRSVALRRESFPDVDVKRRHQVGAVLDDVVTVVRVRAIRDNNSELLRVGSTVEWSPI